jgi:hypothetical protein
MRILKIYSIILIILLAPSVCFAAWWNPFTWFSNTTPTRSEDAKTKILEDRIKELEKRLEGISIVPIATSSINIKATPTASPSSLEKMEKTSTKISPKIEIDDFQKKSNYQVPKANINQSILTNDSHAAFLDLMTKYLNLYNKINSEREPLIDSLSEIKNARSLYLASLINILKNEKSSLDKLSALKSPPLDAIKNIEANINEVEEGYTNSFDNYEKNLLAEYFKENRERLHLSYVHIEAANLLNLYDHKYGTRYGLEFRKTETPVEVKEFADTLIYDLELD